MGKTHGFSLSVDNQFAQNASNIVTLTTGDITIDMDKTVSPAAVPFLVGAAISVMIVTLGPLTGASINPG